MGIEMLLDIHLWFFFFFEYVHMHIRCHTTKQQRINTLSQCPKSLSDRNSWMLEMTVFVFQMFQEVGKEVFKEKLLHIFLFYTYYP